MGRVVALLIALWGSVVSAQSDPVAMALQAARDLQTAAQIPKSAVTPEEQVMEVSRLLRLHEDGLAAMREGLRRAAARAGDIRRQFRQEQDKLSGLLGVLLVLSRDPETQILMHPSGPVATSRLALIASSTSEVIESEARRLRALLEELESIRQAQQQALPIVERSYAELQALHQALTSAIAERVVRPKDLSVSLTRMARLRETSDTLDVFATEIAALISAEPDSGLAFARRKGRLDPPAIGRLTDSAEVGSDGTHAIIATPPGALVTTPANAVVRYAGDFPGHGVLIVLEPAEGFLILLSGLARSYVETGEVLERGSPLGVMAGENPRPDAILTADGEPKETKLSEPLYIELRQGTTTLDPTEWFALTEE